MRARSSLQTDILLMDEPFAALDEQTRMYLGEELSVLLATTNKTIILVTHSLSEAVFLADRVVVMTARPAAIKATIEVPEKHPRDPGFMASPRSPTIATNSIAICAARSKRRSAALSARQRRATASAAAIDGQRSRRTMKRIDWQARGIQIGFVVVACGVWYYLGAARIVSSIFLPPLPQVLDKLVAGRADERGFTKICRSRYLSCSSHSASPASAAC